MSLIPLQRTNFKAVCKSRNAKSSSGGSLFDLSSLKFINNKVDAQVANVFKNPEFCKGVVTKSSQMKAYHLEKADKWSKINNKAKKIVKAQESKNIRKEDSAIYSIVRFAGQGCESRCFDCSGHEGHCYAFMTVKQLKTFPLYDEVEGAHRMTADELRGAMCDLRDGEYKSAPANRLNWNDESTEDFIERYYSTTRQLC